jgi:hypothetical protein
LSTNSASGQEDTAIDLIVDVSLSGPADEHDLSLLISGVPEGAELSTGTDNGDGTWSLSPTDLQGLTFLPTPDSASDLTLTVTATATDPATGGSTSTSGSVDVTISGVADAPEVMATDTSGAEDNAIVLGIDAAVTGSDLSETISSVVIEGVPVGASLSAGTDNGDGSWTLTAAQLAGLSLTPAAHDDSDFDLIVTATTSEEGTTATSSAGFVVNVSGVADAPLVTVSDATGLEDQAIALDISTEFVDLDGSEDISVVISGVPEGARLSAGSDNGDGSWSLNTRQLRRLKITPAEDDADP